MRRSPKNLASSRPEATYGASKLPPRTRLPRAWSCIQGCRTARPLHRNTTYGAWTQSTAAGHDSAPLCLKGNEGPAHAHYSLSHAAAQAGLAQPQAIAAATARETMSSDFQPYRREVRSQSPCTPVAASLYLCWQLLQTQVQHCMFLHSSLSEQAFCPAERADSAAGRKHSHRSI